MQQHRRDGHQQTQYCGHQGAGDTASHGLGITGTEDGNRLEGNDHTGHRTEQTHQRRHRSNDLEQGQTRLQFGSFLEYTLRHFQLQGLGIHIGAGFVDRQYPPQRIVLVGLVRLELAGYLGADQGQDQHPVNGQQEGKRPHGSNGIADVTALVPALFEGRAVNNGRQERTPGGTCWVNAELVQSGAGTGEIGRLTAKGTAGLSRQLTELAVGK